MDRLQLHNAHGRRRRRFRTSPGLSGFLSRRIPSETVHRVPWPRTLQLLHDGLLLLVSNHRRLGHVPEAASADDQRRYGPHVEGEQVRCLHKEAAAEEASDADVRGASERDLQISAEAAVHLQSTADEDSGQEEARPDEAQTSQTATG